MPEIKPPACPICKDAGWLKGPGPMGTTVRCVCSPAREELPSSKATKPLMSPVDPRYSARLDS